MAEMTQETLRRTVLRAEIMALLHDVGKLNRYFVLQGAGLEKYGDELERLGLPLPLDTRKNKPRKPDLTDVHTAEFLIRNLEGDEALAALQQRLCEKLGDWLDAVPGKPLQALGSLLVGHHSGDDLGNWESVYPWWKSPVGTSADENFSYFMPLVMYADNADSLYTKGSESSTENTQGRDIFLTSPFGREEARIRLESLQEDAHNLRRDLAQALEGWKSWSDEELPGKREKVRKLLRLYGGRHLAETRLPNNDVSLWQHSASVAGIFKALLAGCLLSGRWEGLLRHKKLAHVNQRLSLLAFRWDGDACMARSMRSFEIVGRTLRMEKVADELQNVVETEYCLGNELYRDRSGICFLVPDLALARESGLYAQILEELYARMEEIGNRITDGELPWSVHGCDVGLQLGDFLSFWRNAGPALRCGPAEPAWRKQWQGAGRVQVCPRCGVHSLKFDGNRSGGSADKACDSCQKVAEEGRKYLDRMGANLSGAKSGAFLTFIKADEEGAADTGARVALIQGVFSLEALRGEGETGWAHLLTPPGGKNWGEAFRNAREAWRKLSSLQEDDEKLRKEFASLKEDEEEKALREKFASLLGMDKRMFAKKDKDGWCSDEAVGLDLKSRIEDIVRRMVFGGTLPEKEEDIVSGILLWGAREHPAPSRLARVWEELCAFTAWASGLGRTDMDEADWLRLPLTKDVTSFQLIVPARDAWRVLRDIQARYAERFGKVRHILPLHLSAGVFRRKAPLYIAMDAARRFRTLAEKLGPEVWEIRSVERRAGVIRLVWRTAGGRQAVWNVPRLLPNKDASGSFREDVYRTWYYREGETFPMHLSELSPGMRCRVWPSSFDFEVLDASVRRYDIRYGRQGEGRPHYMMRRPGPRPYPLEVLETWGPWLDEGGRFKASEEGQRQRKNALELLAGLHLNWGAWEDARDESSASHGMARDILAVTMADDAEALLPFSVDGSFFDMCEWSDFITK